MTHTMTQKKTQIPQETFEGQFLVFYAGGYKLGIDVFNTKGVTGLRKMQIALDLPEKIRGYIELLGEKTYVLDCGQLLGKKPVKIDDRSCAIILEYPTQNGTKEIALAVDKIEKVEKIRANKSFTGDSKIERYSLAHSINNTIILDIDKLILDNDFQIGQ
ncbi:MAG: chemotaxis protein CheW [Candidatus Zixiibacteriota bacterium]